MAATTKRLSRRNPHGTCGRHRPWDDQLRRLRPRRWRAHRHRQRRGLADDAVRRRLRQERRGARRRGRQAPGGDQRGPHHPLGQAPHGHRLEDRDRRQALHAAADQRVHPAEAQARRRGLPRREGHRRGHHRPGLLLRRRAPGHQGGRRDRGPERPAHHQRAHRRGPRLRPGQGRGRPDHPGLRPRRRHLRRLAAGSRRGRLSPSRSRPPTATTTSVATTGTSGRRLAGHQVQERARRRPVQGQDGPAAAARGRREGQDRAVQLDRDQRSTCPTSPPPPRARCTWTRSSPAPSSSS